MRWIGGIAVFLIFVGFLAAAVRGPEPPAGRMDSDWRRTRYGWEHAGWLGPPIPVREPSLHPGVVGLLQLLVSVSALAILSVDRSRRQRVPERAGVPPSNMSGRGRQSASPTRPTRSLRLRIMPLAGL